MGSPGSGKTTTAEEVGHRLNRPVIDVDDYLENFWSTSVASKVYLSVSGLCITLMTYQFTHVIQLNFIEDFF